MKKKKTFDSPQWNLTSIEIKENKEDYLSLVFYGPIYPKKKKTNKNNILQETNKDDEEKTKQ